MFSRPATAFFDIIPIIMTVPGKKNCAILATPLTIIAVMFPAILICPFLVSAPLWAGAQADAAADEDGLYRLIPDKGVYLGWMPAAYVTAGEKFSVDLSRFMDADPGTKITPLDEPGSFAPGMSVNGRFLEISVPEERSGLFDLPVSVQKGGAAGKTYLTLVINRITRRQFAYKPRKPVKKAAVAGSFNGWSGTAAPMNDDDNDGVWEASVPLDPGNHTYKFVVDGEWIPDPGNPDISADQYRNSLLTIEAGTTRTRPYLIPERRDRNGIVLRAGAENGEPLHKISALIQKADGSNRKAGFTMEKDLLRVDIAGAGAGSYLRVIVMDREGGVSAPLRIPLGDPAVFSWNDAVIYFALLDRFKNGDPGNDAPTKDPDILYPNEYHGGDLAGLLTKIEDGYFTSLGVNALWLSPVYQNPDKAFREYAEPRRYFSGYHGYWPTDFKKIDRRLGDMALLKKVVAAAHGRGIRVLFDMVFNHTHADHPYWREHPDWYAPLRLPDGRENLRLWNEYPFTTWFDRFLPTLDLDRQALVMELLENAKWWLEETGADGFRLDAVKHIRHHFWCSLRKYLRAAVERKRKERLYLVGETFLDRKGIMEFVGPDKLDGQFDFPLYDAVIPAFASGAGSFRDLDAALEAGERAYGKETVPLTLIGNQDKARFMAYADGDLPDAKIADDREVGYVKPPKADSGESYARLRHALTFIFTIDGAPLIYYGDEYGMTGAGDPDNRRDMRFGDELSGPEKEMLAFTGGLGRIRGAHPALRLGSRRTVLLESGLYAYARAWFDDRMLVIFNKSPLARKVSIRVSPDLPAGRYRNLLGEQEAEVDADGFFETTVLPMTSVIFSKV